MRIQVYCRKCGQPVSEFDVEMTIRNTEDGEKIEFTAYCHICKWNSNYHFNRLK
jgi:RNase P subunit RPR2